MDYKLYIWRKNILTGYRDGIALALAYSVEEASTRILAEYYKEEIEPSTIPGEIQEDDEWPMSSYRQLQKALEQEPEVYDKPTAIYKYGGD